MFGIAGHVPCGRGDAAGEAVEIGRGHVAALVSGPIEIPSDLSGVLYIDVDSIADPAWRFRLASEMKAAGLDVDLNRVR